jgi:hypothetical protein
MILEMEVLYKNFCTHVPVKLAEEVGIQWSLLIWGGTSI